MNNWEKEFPSAITVCDEDGVILYMNDKSCKTFEKDGGKELIGTNILNCHPEPARSKVKAMLQQGNSNSYTIEKNGIKKLIHQSPWFENGKYMGFVELSIELPLEMPHFVRK
ncbi:MAG: PAS domain-containing protein [Bacteroidetes bacterium]|nr:PAS domain-containing protein [Bacteroidota bacterium]